MYSTCDKSTVNFAIIYVKLLVMIKKNKIGFSIFFIKYPLINFEKYYLLTAIYKKPETVSRV